MTFEDLCQWVVDQTDDEPEIRARLLTALTVVQMLEEHEERSGVNLLDPLARS